MKRSLALALGTALVAGGSAAHAETVLRVAMTAGDIPITVGIPDQGFEGYRFVGYSLYDGLLGWDLSNGPDAPSEVIPALATAYEIDPENPQRWIFTLREGVTYHDGCPFNAENVKWNYDRLTIEGHPSFNAQQYGVARVRANNIDSVEIVDDYTVAINTKTIDSLFPLQTSFILLISDCALEAAGGDYAAYATAPAGTGPYIFDSLVPRERLELLKNENYWNPDRVPKHDRLVLLPMPEATTRAAALVAGQVDFVEAPSPDTIPMLEGSGMVIHTAAYPHNWGYQLNFVDGPFADLRVRQAANHALNRDEMEAMLSGYAIGSYGAYPPGSPYYGNPIRYEYDPEKARAMLEEAGCLPCDVTIAISTSGSGQMQPLPMNELVKSQLDAAGFNVTFDVMDWNQLTEVGRLGRPNFPQYHGINISRALQEPFSGIFRFVLRSQFGPNGANFGHYESDEMEDLVARIYASFDDAERDALIVEAHEAFVNEALMIFIAHDTNPRALAPNLEGFSQAQSWFQDLTQITVN